MNSRPPWPRSCALATGPSRLSGIAHLRGHETDRLAALVTEINRLGGDAEETADGLVIRPAKLHGGVVHSYADHRMATAGAILGLAVHGVEVEDIGTTSKTMPDFPQLWEAMLHGSRACRRNRPVGRSTGSWDESDIRIRPNKKGTRPRTKDRPSL